MSQHQPPAAQSNGWIVQTYISFAVSMSALALGIAYMPGDPWKRAFLAVAALYAVTSSISLSKTVRDQHESSPCRRSGGRGPLRAAAGRARPVQGAALKLPGSAPGMHVRGRRLGEACRVEIWSDVVCPWCYVGTRRFEQAVERLGAAADDVEVVHRAFELDPTVPAEGMDLAGYLARKFGGADRLHQVRDRLDHAGADVDIDFRWDGKRRRQHLRRPPADRLGARRRWRPHPARPAPAAVPRLLHRQPRRGRPRRAGPAGRRGRARRRRRGRGAGHGRVRRDRAGRGVAGRTSSTSTRCQRS